MKKRLRKKLKKGEFTEYGFGITLLWAEPLSVEEVDSLVVQLDTIFDSLNLDYGGGFCAKEFWGFVTRYKGSCTEKDRKAVLEKTYTILKNPEVIIEPLKDAWR